MLSPFSQSSQETTLVGSFLKCGCSLYKKKDSIAAALQEFCYIFQNSYFSFSFDATASDIKSYSVLFLSSLPLSLNFFFKFQTPPLILPLCETDISKALARRCSAKKVFFEISQISKENTCARVSFLKKLQA